MSPLDALVSNASSQLTANRARRAAAGGGSDSTAVWKDGDLNIRYQGPTAEAPVTRKKIDNGPVLIKKTDSMPKVSQKGPAALKYEGAKDAATQAQANVANGTAAIAVSPAAASKLESLMGVEAKVKDAMLKLSPEDRAIAANMAEIAKRRPFTLAEAAQMQTVNAKLFALAGLNGSGAGGGGRGGGGKGGKPKAGKVNSIKGAAFEGSSSRPSSGSPLDKFPKAPKPPAAPRPDTGFRTINGRVVKIGPGSGGGGGGGLPGDMKLSPVNYSYKGFDGSNLKYKGL